MPTESDSNNSFPLTSDGLDVWRGTQTSCLTRRGYVWHFISRIPLFLFPAVTAVCHYNVCGATLIIQVRCNKKETRWILSCWLTWVQTFHTTWALKSETEPETEAQRSWVRQNKELKEKKASIVYSHGADTGFLCRFPHCNELKIHWKQWKGESSRAEEIMK